MFDDNVFVVECRLRHNRSVEGTALALVVGDERAILRAAATPAGYHALP